VDHVPPAVRSRIMASVRAWDTKPDITVRRALHAAGLRYRLHVQSLPGKPDIVLPSRNVAIFVHGCFWHGCPKCRRSHNVKSNLAYWAFKLERNRRRDQHVRMKLRKHGWNVRIIWECEARSLERLEEFVDSIAMLPASQR